MYERGASAEMEDLMGKIQEVLSDEESMKQISELAQMFSSESSNDNTENSQHAAPDMGFDVSKLLLVQNAVQSAGNDKNTELLLALRPFLKDEKQAKVDKAVKVLKLLAVWNVLKDSGLMNDLF